MAYVPAPNFGAAFAQAFTTTLAEGIDKRKDRRDKLIDLSVESAKRMAPKYAAAQNDYKSVLDIGDRLKSEYGVTDAEFVALTQETDIQKFFQTVVAQDATRQAIGRNKLNKQDFMSAFKLPDNVIPEGMSREQAVAQILGLQTAKLKEEGDPKSEGAQDRSWRGAIGNFMVSNPKLSAEEAIQGMKVMGYDVNDMSSYTGIKQDISSGVTRNREILFNDIGYDNNTYGQTQRLYNSRLATKLSGGSDLSDPDTFRASAVDLDVAGKETLAAKRDMALDGSMAFAKLELGIINSGLGLGLIGSSQRRIIMEGLFSAVDDGQAGQAEVETLMERIESGEAVEAITALYQEKGLNFTRDDYEAIISGEEPVADAGAAAADAGAAAADAGAETGAETDAAAAQTDKIISDSSPLVVDESPIIQGDPKSVEELKVEIGNQTDPVLKKILENELKVIEEEEARPSIQGTGARATAQTNIDTMERMRQAASNITFEEYKKMSRRELREAGLGDRPMDRLAAFGIRPRQYFKDGVKKPETGQLADELKEFENDKTKGLSDFGIIKPREEVNTPQSDSEEDTPESNAEAVMAVLRAMNDEFDSLTLKELSDEDVETFLEQNDVILNERLLKLLKAALKY